MQEEYPLPASKLSKVDGRREKHVDRESRRQRMRRRVPVAATERRKPEEELRRGEERWRTYVEEAADLIFTTDATGKITSVNRAVCETIGYAAEDLHGKSPLEFVSREYRSLVAATLGKMLSGERVHRVELEALSKDGRHIPLEIRGRALYEGNHIVGTLQIARDITERKRMEEEVKQYSERLEGLVEERTGRFVQLENDWTT
jgi:PAS domain S-box-containing protein